MVCLHKKYLHPGKNGVSIIITIINTTPTTTTTTKITITIIIIIIIIIINTSIITERVYKHLDENDLLPKEQKGCRRGSYGCKDQLLINKAIIEDAKKRKKNLSTAWIDYKKAFDSVPHDWILKCLEMYKLSPIIVQFLAASMDQWKTTLILNHSEGTLYSRQISINSGIFQGDSLSPLLFCMALAPLSSLLNNTSYGYTISTSTINHLFYMDDLKTFGKNDREQTSLLTIVKGFSDDIQMEFGLEKCSKAAFKKGKLTTTENIQIDLDTTIQQLEQEGTYKYLGVNEGDGIQHAKMKEKIRKEYYCRIRMITKSELNAINRMEAINTLATPVVTYSFNIVDWKMEEIEKPENYSPWKGCTTQEQTWIECTSPEIREVEV